MENFKVICKNTQGWAKEHPKQSLKTTKYFLGLFKSTRLVSENVPCPGPAKDEICLVTEQCNFHNSIYYVIAGYPYGQYASRLFVRMDEIGNVTYQEIKESLPQHSNS